MAWTTDRFSLIKWARHELRPFHDTLTEESEMRTHRFGRKLKLPSTMAIKHGILRLMLQDELKRKPPATKADEGRSAPRVFS